MTEANQFPVLNFQDFISADGDQLTTDSRKVAAVHGKRHADVLRSACQLIADAPCDFAQRNFALVMESMTYVDKDGQSVTKKTSRVSHCTMTKDGYALLAMGFTGKKALAFKVAYIGAFNAMASYLKNQRDGLQYRYFQLQLEHKGKKAKASLCGQGLNEWKGEKPVLETAMKSIEEKMCPELPLIH